MDAKKIVSSLIKYGIPILISVGLAWFLYKNVDLEAIKQSLSEDVNYWWFLPVIVISTFSHIFRAMRWRLQLRTIGVNAPLHAIICSIFGTYFVNLLFPRLGEVWRSGYIAQREKASFSQVLGSMVADRLSDTVTVLIITIFTFLMAQDAFLKFLAQKEGGTSVSILVMAGVGVAFVLGVALLVWLYRTRSTNHIIMKLQSIVHDLWDGLASIARMDGKWWFLLYTVLIWGCYYMQLYVASKAFSFTAELGWLPILVLFVLSSIGMAVPSNGGLGPWQFTIIFGLTLYGVGAFPPSVPYDAQASAFAWLVWGVQTLLLIVLGIYAFTYIALDRKKK
ncbi:MAG: flippase-like domain-containing protein [Muribaculaceae bacterium]|nr:flippase-like domain-containing protein [Muribaculaceae bacterium]